jgi:hypothetical protein
VNSRFRRLWVAAVAAPLTAVAIAACSAGGSAEEPTRTDDCPHRAIFAGLAQITGRVALCPRWLPDSLGVSTSHASADPPSYVVDFVVDSGSTRSAKSHLVLSFGSEEPPGRPVGSVSIEGRETTVLFNPPASGPPGLHSGHYLVELSAPVDQRGTYSLSLHGDPNQSRQQNVSTLVRIAESLTPVSQ